MWWCCPQYIHYFIDRAMRKTLLTILLTLGHTLAHAQITLDDYCTMVEDYNIALQQSTLSIERTEAEWQRARRGHLPTLSMGRQAVVDFARNIDGRRWSWSTSADIEQSIYRGGKISASARRAELEHEISILQHEMVCRGVRLSAEQAYWRLSHAEEYRKSMEEYVAIIESLRSIIKYRYEEGYSAKGDLLQIESRLSAARYELSQAEEAYDIALHGFNSLYSSNISASATLAETILSPTTKPQRTDIDTMLWSHPEYRTAQLRAQQAHADIKIARAPFLPQIGMSIYGSLQPTLPHTAASKIEAGGGAVLNFSTLIYHFGERRQAVNAAKSAQLSSELDVENIADNLCLIEQDSWTNIERTEQRVASARQSLRIAHENLDISTYAYNEGQTTIVDVLQAQISWLEAYRNMLSAHYDHHMAVAEYRYIVGEGMRRE